MNYTLEFTEHAFDTFESIKSQVESKWGSKLADTFEERTFKIIRTIQSSPLIYQPISNNQSVHKAVIHKNCSVFYEVSGSKIEILFFWDNRQDPIFI